MNQFLLINDVKVWLFVVYNNRGQVYIGEWQTAQLGLGVVTLEAEQFWNRHGEDIKG